MNTKSFIFILLAILSLEGMAFPLKRRKREVMETYYANGELKFKSITIVIGGGNDDFGVFEKTITQTWKYYENGKKELEQHTVERPARSKRDEMTGQRINTIPKRTRKYKHYDHSGKLTEEGWEKTGKSKNIMYNTDIYRKIITKNNVDWRFPKVKYLEKERPVRNLEIYYIKKK